MKKNETRKREREREREKKKHTHTLSLFFALLSFLLFQILYIYIYVYPPASSMIPFYTISLYFLCSRIPDIHLRISICSVLFRPHLVAIYVRHIPSRCPSICAVQVLFSFSSSFLMYFTVLSRCFSLSRVLF